MRTAPFLLLLVGMIPLAGCQSQPKQSTTSTNGPGARTVPAAADPIPDSLNVAAELSTFFQRAKAAPSWRTADRKIQSALETASPIPSRFRNEAAAHAMLTVHFDTVETSLSPDKRAILGRYTDLFVTHSPSESDVVRPALEMLRGHWSDDRLVAAIDTVLRASWTEYHVDPKGIEPHIPRVHDEIKQANQRLRSLKASLVR